MDDAHPHDVLAAEEFSVPAQDPALHHGPVTVPAAPFDDGGPPHDVLAAEEFAVPAGRVGSGPRATASSGRRVRLLTAGALGTLVTVLLRRLR